MTSDLPDYTFQIVLNVDAPAAKLVFPSKAEAATKIVKTEKIISAGNICEITPSDGKKVVLLVVKGSAQTAGDNIKIQTLQSSVWTTIDEVTWMIANGHFYFTYPCWKPDQDTGDGSTKTFRLVGAGTGDWSGTILYYEE